MQSHSDPSFPPSPHHLHGLVVVTAVTDPETDNLLTDIFLAKTNRFVEIVHYCSLSLGIETSLMMDEGSQYSLMRTQVVKVKTFIYVHILYFNPERRVRDRDENILRQQHNNLRVLCRGDEGLYYISTGKCNLTKIPF